MQYGIDYTHPKLRYLTSLTELDTKGLPNDANHEMHEDYIMWHHRTDAAEMESFPHHKHVEQRGNLQPSMESSLEEVMRVIQRKICQRPKTVKSAKSVPKK